MQEVSVVYSTGREPSRIKTTSEYWWLKNLPQMFTKPSRRNGRDLNDGKRLDEPYAAAGVVVVQLNSAALQLEFLLAKPSTQFPSHILTCGSLEAPKPYNLQQKSTKKIREPFAYSINKKIFPAQPDFLSPRHKSFLSSTLFDSAPEKATATPDSWTAATRPGSASSFGDFPSPSLPER